MFGRERNQKIETLEAEVTALRSSNKKVLTAVRSGLVRAERRGFEAGMMDRLTSTFTGSYVPVNEDIKQHLKMMRSRSRHLAMNNDYARKFINMIKVNVIGTNGIQLQARAMRDNQELDIPDNTAIESAWREWGRPGNCSNDRKNSFRDIQNLAIGAVATDGECLIQMIETPGDAFGLRLRIMPGEYLDENFNGDLSNGNKVVMGIEYSRSGIVEAYHIRKRNVKPWVNVYPERDYWRVPAEDMIHLHLMDYPEQARGIPWMHTAIRRLNFIGRYEEAELVGSVLGASKMGFIKGAKGDNASLADLIEDSGGDEYDDGEQTMSIEPGVIDQLSADEEFIAFDPQHPKSAFDGFMRAVLRGAASGLLVSYPGLANDLENVNFSSIRQGALEERDMYRCLQQWLIEHLLWRVYDRWIWSAIVNNRLRLPMRLVDTKFKQIRWQPRGWSWIDPKKDAEANRINLKMGVETRQNILAQQGRDFDDVIDQLKYEKDRAEKAGISIDDLDKETLQVEVENDDG